MSFLISGCEKESTHDYRNFLGTWISTDLTDTVEFTSDNDFYKMFSGVKDHFDYTLSDDSITIGYNGMLFILVLPSTHPYQIKGDELTIDFSPQCYGFRNQVIKFIRN